MNRKALQLHALLGFLPAAALAVACAGNTDHGRNSAEGGMTGTGAGAASAGNGPGPSGGSSGTTGGNGTGVGGNLGAGGSVTASTGGTSTASTFTLACAQPKLGSPLLRLLNRAEFDRTLNDVFPQLKGQWTNSLPSDTASPYGFDNDAAASVGTQRANALFDTALSVATALVGGTLDATLPCAANAGDRTCAGEFLAQYGKRLFRRPLSQAERERYLVFFDASKAKSDFKAALKWMTVGLIQSPNAVYRSEIGVVQSDGTRLLSPHEVATELAYTFTGTTPTTDLLGKADSGALGDPASLAKTLLASDPTKEALQHFFEGYLGYTRVTSMQKTNIAAFANVSSAMIQETRAFIDDVLFQKGGGLKDLLIAPTTNPSATLAAYYGFPAPSAENAAVVRPNGRGIGVLAQGSFLATHANASASSPTQRGLFPFARLLCQDKPPVPKDVPPLDQKAPPSPAKTTRQRYEELHASAEPCSTCHKLFDPIGFGFEHFDEGGIYRDQENGQPINSAAVVPKLGGGMLFSFANQEELAKGFAEQPAVYQCFAGYLAAYAFGTGESCLGTSRIPDLQSGALGIAEAFTALASEPHFTRRSGQ